MKNERDRLALKNIFVFKILIIVFCLTVRLNSQSRLAPDQPLKSTILQMAQEFTKVGDWKNALITYHEFLYRFPKDTLVSSIYLKIAMINEEAGNKEVAEKRYRECITRCVGTESDIESRLRFALFLYEQKHFRESLEFSARQPETVFQTILLYDLINLHAIIEADSLARRLIDLNTQKMPIIEIYFQQKAPEGNSLLIKKWSAVLMSVLIPGSGQMLLGDYWDAGLTLTGFVSLVGAAVFINSVHSSFFYVIGTSAVFYYVGNLYSVVQMKDGYQSAVREKKIIRLTDRYTLREALQLSPLMGKIN